MGKKQSRKRVARLKRLQDLRTPYENSSPGASPLGCEQILLVKRLALAALFALTSKPSCPCI